MISAIVATLNDERRLSATLTALVPAAINGLVREVLFADGGSTDATAEIAEDAGAAFIHDVDHDGENRGARALAHACDQARGPWLLLLGPGTRLRPDWEAAAERHIRTRPDRAGWFKLVVESRSLGARWREGVAAARSGLFGLPGPDQGLLMSKRLYARLLSEGAGPSTHAELIRWLGRRRLAPISAGATID
jgi:glycosyltransferase involved in cell wall biosynthesis